MRGALVPCSISCFKISARSHDLVFSDSLRLIPSLAPRIQIAQTHLPSWVQGSLFRFEQVGQ